MSDVVEVDPAELTTVTTRAAGVLRQGGLVVAPAGPMYGVYADVTLEAATAAIFAARGAPRSAPLPVVIHNPRQLLNYADPVPDEAERLIASYWPGPLTLIFRMLPSLPWHVGDGDGSVALRMPLEPLALMMVNKVGPLACTAAARAGAPPPATVAEAREQLGDAVALYLDDGVRDGAATTIVDVSRGGVEVLREGEVPAHHVTLVAAGEVEPGGRPVDAPPDPDDGPTTPS